MKISVVAPFPACKDGIPRVAEELIAQLSKAACVDSISIIGRQDLGFISPSILANANVHLYIFRFFLAPWTFLRIVKLYKQSTIFLCLAMPWEVLNSAPALYIFTRLIIYGFLPQKKWVQVLYDFVPYVHAEDTAQRAMRLYDFFKKHLLEIPIRYVAISESTKRDAVRYWGLPADRIDVIHLGSFVAPKTPRTQFGSKKILTVSDISPRKNQLRLMEAFELVHRANPGSNAELIIVGYLRKEIPEFESTLDDIRKRNEGINIKLAGYLADSEVLSLYEQADVFIYPSLYEGFGLPVLEAMACGCPVIASNVYSLPEVVGEAGLLVDPYDVEALAFAMNTVLEDDDLKREMSVKGVAQAQKFSWDKAGTELLAVCREIALRGTPN